MNHSKEYVGDGIYIQKGEYNEIVLTTEDGITVTNTIYLEAQHLKFIITYIDRHRSDV